MRQEVEDCVAEGVLPRVFLSEWQQFRVKSSSPLNSSLRLALNLWFRSSRRGIRMRFRQTQRGALRASGLRCLLRDRPYQQSYRVVH